MLFTESECIFSGHFIFDVHFCTSQSDRLHLKHGSQEEEGSQAVVLVRTECVCTLA